MMNLGGKYHLACIMKVKMKSLSCVQLFATSWTISYQAPLSMQFSRQEYWSGLPSPSPGDLPDPVTELASLMSPALAGSPQPNKWSFQMQDLPLSSL